MAARVQLQPHHRVAEAQQRQIDGHVRLRAGVRLQVRVLHAEERLRPLPAQVLHAVDLLVAVVVAGTRVPLRVLVREDGTDRLHDRRGGVVFGGDHLQHLLLATFLEADDLGDLRVDLLQRTHDLLPTGPHGRGRTC